MQKGMSITYKNKNDLKTDFMDVALNVATGQFKIKSYWLNVKFHCWGPSMSVRYSQELWLASGHLWGPQMVSGKE